MIGRLDFPQRQNGKMPLTVIIMGIHQLNIRTVSKLRVITHQRENSQQHLISTALLPQSFLKNMEVNYIKGDFAGASETLGECISISANGGVSNWANHGGTATKGYFLQTDLYAIVSADGGYTTPVGTYAPNTLGLYDMAGNCWDITSSIIVANNGLEQGGVLLRSSRRFLVCYFKKLYSFLSR